MLEVKTAIILRNSGMAIIAGGAALSLISGLFVEKGTSLAILLWPLFIGFFVSLFAPYFAKGCPNCAQCFFGKWYKKDLFTSYCKNCGHHL